MTVNAVPEKDPIALDKIFLTAKAWLEFFRSVYYALFGWRRSFTGTVTFDFGSINAQTQATTTLTVTGCRAGDAVIVRPSTAVNGIILDGTVTSNDTVTIRAVNYSSGAIDPASQAYRVIVLQQ
jgi:hypothetical protein